MLRISRVRLRTAFAAGVISFQSPCVLPRVPCSRKTRENPGKMFAGSSRSKVSATSADSWTGNRRPLPWRRRLHSKRRRRRHEDPVLGSLSLSLCPRRPPDAGMGDWSLGHRLRHLRRFDLRAREAKGRSCGLGPQRIEDLIDYCGARGSSAVPMALARRHQDGLRRSYRSRRTSAMCQERILLPSCRTTGNRTKLPSAECRLSKGRYCRGHKPSAQNTNPCGPVKKLRGNLVQEW